ncbi:MAG: AmmeMemoRadiSam system protein B [Fibrobacteres bacterium]|nr:AmmeMemoRadiSam system protein B [Fibrobacterota bacterium]
MDKEITRKCAVADAWYPGNKEALLQMIQDLDRLASSVMPSNKSIAGLIAPHAGYIYSGRTAAKGFRAVSTNNYQDVIIIGTSHRHNNGTIALFQGDAVETPFGNLKINKQITNEILESSDKIKHSELIHSKEHSLEAMFPFIHYYLNAPSVTLILTATNDESLLFELGNTLYGILKAGKGKTLLLASTDMSHFHPYDEATGMDKETVDLIANGKLDELAEKIYKGDSELCGFNALIPFFVAMQRLGCANPEIIAYENSGDAIPGTREKGVVGYMSAIYERKQS